MSPKERKGRPWGAFEQAAALCLAGTLVGVLVNYGALVGGSLLPMGAAAERPWRISAGSLEEELHWGRTVVVDAKSRNAYERGHIPGSIWMDLEAGERQLAALSSYLPTDALITLVSAKTGRDAQRDMRRLLALGLQDVRLLTGGVETWRRAGGRIVSGWDMDALLRREAR